MFYGLNTPLITHKATIMVSKVSLLACWNINNADSVTTETKLKMINFSFKRPSNKIKNVFDRRMYTSYLKDFNKALLNLELNLQEEKVRELFKQ